MQGQPSPTGGGLTSRVLLVWRARRGGQRGMGAQSDVDTRTSGCPSVSGLGAPDLVEAERKSPSSPTADSTELPRFPDFIIAATAELARLTVIHCLTASAAKASYFPQRTQY